MGFTRTNRAKLLRNLIGEEVTAFGGGTLFFGYHNRNDTFVQCSPHDFPDARVKDMSPHSNLGYYVIAEGSHQQLFVRDIDTEWIRTQINNTEYSER